MFHAKLAKLPPKGGLTGLCQCVSVVHQKAWNNRQQGPLQVSMSRRVSCLSCVYFETAKHNKSPYGVLVPHHFSLIPIQHHQTVSNSSRRRWTQGWFIIRKQKKSQASEKCPRKSPVQRGGPRWLSTYRTHRCWVVVSSNHENNYVSIGIVIAGMDGTI